MALYFDLSIPYLERGGADNKTLKSSRLRCAVRAMELGYSAVAYDRPHRGVLSDADRCAIPPFPLPALLAAAPALAASASFHRSLVGAPKSAPFRQYSRITVLVDSAAAASALNSANSVVRTYDVVAARPVNQAAFDEVCKVSQIDIIAIDFSRKLPFRLKLPMIHAATQRGIHFEITYSHLIGDVNIRRQMLSDAKLLVDWTRGKNIIFSSAASTVSEIRGPNDIANLSAFLLGLPMERAKKAISGNCRSLIANTLRRKHCFKEAIRIERILPNTQRNSAGDWFGDWKDWDPISSGEGDILPLDDTAKFSRVSEVPKSPIASNFMSVNYGTHPYAQISGEDNHISKNPKTSTSFFPEEPVSLVSQDAFIQQGGLIEPPVEENIITSITPIEQQTCNSGDNLVSSSQMVTIFANAEECDLPISGKEDRRNVNIYSIVSDTTEMLLDDISFRNCVVNNEDNLITAAANLSPAIEGIQSSNLSMDDHECSDGAICAPSLIETLNDASNLVDCIDNISGDQALLHGDGVILTLLKENDMPEDQIVVGPNEKENTTKLSNFIDTTSQRCDLIIPTQNALPLCNDMHLDGTNDEIKERSQLEFLLAGTDNSSATGLFKTEEHNQSYDTEAAYGIRPPKVETGNGRKTLADSRPRVRGRFARNGESEMETEAETSNTMSYYDGSQYSCSSSGNNNNNIKNYDEGELWQQMQVALGTTEEEDRCGYDEDLLATFVDVFSMNLLS